MKAIRLKRDQFFEKCNPCVNFSHIGCLTLCQTTLTCCNTERDILEKIVMTNGVVLLVLAMSLTPGLDGLSKYLSLEYSPFLFCFFRYLSAGLIALFTARILRQPIHVPKEGRIGQVVRTGLLVASMCCLITALSLVPMALAAGGFLVAPLVSTIVGIAILGEKATLPRVFGAALSLVGAAMITRPETGIEFGTVIALLGGGFLGVYLAATRGSSNTGGALSSLAVQCLLGALLVAPLAFYNGLPEFSWGLLAAVLGLGVLSAMAHYLTVAAFERTDASVLSPFLYFNLIAALVAGYLWFNEVPSLWSMMGLTLIAGGGLVTLMPTSIFARMLAPVLEPAKAGLGRVVPERLRAARFRPSPRLTIG